MIINLRQVIVLLPILIIGLAIVVLMLSIVWRRNHFFSAVLSCLSLKFALLCILFIFKKKYDSINITPLLYIDNHAILYIALTLISSLTTCIFSYPWLKSFNDNREEFYLLILISTIGGILSIGANNLIMLFLSMEIFSLPLFGLVGYLFRQKRSLEASIKYMVLSSIASSFLLFGIALLYTQIGNLSFSVFNKILIANTLNNSLLEIISLGLIIVGLSFKLSLMPFHLWSPDVYQGAPTPVSNFLTTVGKIIIFNVMMRMFLYFPFRNNEAIRIVLIVIAFISIIIGNIMALNQNNIKRLFAYSSISHLGYLLASLITLKNSQISIEAITIYIINYLLANIGIFGILSLISSPYSPSKIDSLFFYRGLFWHYPILSVVMNIMIFSLAGIPATLGFISKFYILNISIQANLWPITIAIIIGSIISIYYYVRISINLYLNSQLLQQFNYNSLKNWQYSPSGIIILTSAIFILILGIYPQPLIVIIRNIMA